MKTKSRRRLAVNVLLSLAVGVACVAFAVHGMDGAQVVDALRTLAPSTTISLACAPSLCALRM